MRIITKKNVLILSGILVAAFVITQLVLLLTGWYEKPVKSKSASGYSFCKLENEEVEDEYRENIKIADTYYNFDGLTMDYTISPTISKGEVSVVIYSKKESFNWNSKENLSVIDQIPLKDGEMVMLNSDAYPTNENILIGYMYDENSEFQLDVFATYSTCRWQSIHDNWIAKLPWVKQRYYPEYNVFWEEW